MNLSTSVPKDLLAQAEKGGHLRFIDPNTESGRTSSQPSGSSRSWARMAAVLTELQTALGKQDGRTTTRIIINDIGGADWDEPSPHVSPLVAGCWNHMVQNDLTDIYNRRYTDSCTH